MLYQLFYLDFPGPNTFRIDTLLAQLLGFPLKKGLFYPNALDGSISDRNGARLVFY